MEQDFIDWIFDKYGVDEQMIDSEFTNSELEKMYLEYLKEMGWG